MEISSTLAAAATTARGNKKGTLEARGVHFPSLSLTLYLFEAFQRVI